MNKETKPGPTPRISDEEILAVFRDIEYPVLSTGEVTEQIPLKRRATYNRLQSLTGEGHLKSKQIGGRNTVWWLAE